MTAPRRRHRTAVLASDPAEAARLLAKTSPIQTGYDPAPITRGEPMTEPLPAPRSIRPRKAVGYWPRLVYGVLDRLAHDELVTCDAVCAAAKLDPADAAVRAGIGGALNKLAAAGALTKITRGAFIFPSHGDLTIRQPARQQAPFTPPPTPAQSMGPEFEDRVAAAVADRIVKRLLGER